jgi:hypothetical protein
MERKGLTRSDQTVRGQAGDFNVGTGADDDPPSDSGDLWHAEELVMRTIGNPVLPPGALPCAGQADRKGG